MLSIIPLGRAGTSMEGGYHLGRGIQLVQAREGPQRE
jgi:hypothetical protein